MALLSVQNLQFSIGDFLLLDQVTFHLEDGERVALVGRNGAGKSTFMRILSGELSAQNGTIAVQKDAKSAYLPQEIPLNLQGSVFDIVSSEAANDAQRYEIESIITQLGLPINAPFHNLSGGVKRRVLLARALASKPDVLLLDEPTNHLDIDAIAQMEDFLPRAAKSLLFVTHDRAFLQKIATRIIEIDRGQLTSYDCDYATYLERKVANLEAEIARQITFDKKLAEEEAWLRRGVRARRTRDEGRVRALLKMRKERRQRRELTGSAKINVQDVERSGRLVFEAQNIDFAYKSTFIVKDFSTLILRGDKVGIIGANGTGKTTLLHLLLGKLPPQNGKIRQGTRLQIAYFDQLRDELDEEKTVWQNVAGDNQTVTINGERRHVISYLNDFLFSRDRAHTPVKVLSGGERNRLLLAKLFTQPANLLVMDEPTNDLDIETLDLLEELLVDFKGTLLLVSHDRAFLNNVVSSIIAPVGGGKWDETAGGYDDWMRVRTLAQEQEIAPKPRKKVPSHSRNDKPRRLTFKEKKELRQLPAQIEKMEAEQQELYDLMADPAFYQGDNNVAEKKARLEELQESIAQAYARWEELENIENESV